jgi:signal peptidase II
MPESLSLKTRLFPLVLTLCIVVIDQITKTLIVASIPLREIGFQFGGDFLRIIHVRNPGIAFSIGAGSPEVIRFVVFIVVPIAVMAALLVYLLRSRELTGLQRWVLAGILGGGCGNLIDRVLRPEGVVDFIDVKFYGLFGLERWPTFNVADSSVVVCGILLAISLLFIGRKKA